MIKRLLIWLIAFLLGAVPWTIATTPSIVEGTYDPVVYWGGVIACAFAALIVIAISARLAPEDRL